MPGLVGIMGGRSWIAQALRDAFMHRERRETYIIPKDPNSPEWREMGDLDTLFIFSGRTSPTQEDRQSELNLLRSIRQRALYAPMPDQMILLGSKATRGVYAEHKDHCERIFEPDGRQRIVIRAAAVFGVGQPDNEMLVQSIGRDGTSLKLEKPDVPATFIHIDVLTTRLREAAGDSRQDRHDANRDVSGWPMMSDIPGTFTMTPRQMMALYATWNGERT